MAQVAEAKPIGKANLAQVAAMDKLKQAGWRVEKLKSGYHAYEIHGDRKIGPATSIEALETQVNITLGVGVAEAKAGGDTKAAGKAGGNGKADAASANPERRLPTMEEPEIDELNLQADKCIEALEKKKTATTVAKDEDDIMRQKMHAFGRKRYSRRGWSLVVEGSEKLVIKKAEPGKPKNPRPIKP